jgi:hypothetical protein
MSRYLAFVFLALSASSVLAAPADIPQVIPDSVTKPVLGARAPVEFPAPPAFDPAPYLKPVLGERSNSKVYSENTLRKRDMDYPTSTEDCRLTESSDSFKPPYYTHEGEVYSEDCLTRLALSVPSEKRESCRATGSAGYDEDCLFKKAFEEDWKFDLEKAKEDELAWRAVNPTSTSSDAWSKQFPTSVSDCIIDLELVLELLGGLDGKKAMTKSSGAKSEWSPYSVIPSGETVDNDCLLRLVLGAKIVFDLETCPAKEEKVLKFLDIRSPAADIQLAERSTTELATRADVLALVIGVIEALSLGCLLEVIVKIILAIGIDAKIALGPLELVAELVIDVLALLKI